MKSFEIQTGFQKSLKIQNPVYTNFSNDYPLPLHVLCTRREMNTRGLADYTYIYTNTWVRILGLHFDLNITVNSIYHSVIILFGINSCTLVYKFMNFNSVFHVNITVIIQCKVYFPNSSANSRLHFTYIVNDWGFTTVIARIFIIFRNFHRHLDLKPRILLIIKTIT